MIHLLRVIAGWIGLLLLAAGVAGFVEAMRDIATGPLIPRLRKRRSNKYGL